MPYGMPDKVEINGKEIKTVVDKKTGQVLEGKDSEKLMGLKPFDPKDILKSDNVEINKLQEENDMLRKKLESISGIPGDSKGKPKDNKEKGKENKK